MKKAIVVHSGGMDSSICLAQAIKDYSKEDILSLSFRYGQRHSLELERAKEICNDWNVDHKEITIDCLEKITDNALTNVKLKIEHNSGEAPNTLVIGRNGLMARIAAIHGESMGANHIYMGIIEVEAANSGYRDCSRDYMDIIQSALRIDFGNDSFKICTPIVKFDKKESLKLANSLGVLEYLLEKTITCYEGITGIGCKTCPACLLRNQGIRDYLAENPELNFSYKDQILDT